MKTGKRPPDMREDGGNTIWRWGRNRGDVGRVLGEKQIQREASNEVKGERVSWEESWRAGVSGGGPGCERLGLKGVHRTAAWERGLQARREEQAGRWREGFWGGGV